MSSTFRFATCERHRALGFLQKFYPAAHKNGKVTDTPESAGPVLDYVEKDIFRIPDPEFSNGTVFPSKNWVESKKDEYLSCLQEFHNKMCQS